MPVLRNHKRSGKFEPYSNKMYCVYGPPIREVFRCQICGHRWATARMGGDHPNYCPKCRREHLKVEKYEFRDFSDHIGTDVSDEISDGMQLFSENEILSLLMLRTGQKEFYEEIAERISKSGFTDWKTAIDREYGEITKRTAERANLERKILRDSYGTGPFALHKECPACKGK